MRTNRNSKPVVEFCEARIALAGAGPAAWNPSGCSVCVGMGPVQPAPPLPTPTPEVLGTPGVTVPYVTQPESPY